MTAAHSVDLYPLFVILAIIAFGIGIWLCTRAQWIAGIVAAVIGVLILIYAA